MSRYKNQKYRGRYNERNRRLRIYWRQKAIERFGGKCKWCGFNNELALQFDHIIREAIKDKMDTYASYMHLALDQDALEKYQLLCANCNLIKARTDGSFTFGGSKVQL